MLFDKIKIHYATYFFINMIFLINVVSSVNSIFSFYILLNLIVIFFSILRNFNSRSENMIFKSILMNHFVLSEIYQLLLKL